MRLAWFSPMPPAASGIATCSAELVAGLSAEHQIDVFVDEPAARTTVHGTGTLHSAHEFLSRHRARPYDLTVYQLGNSSHHDYLWPYLFRYPGLVVLHDPHLHHARAAALLRTNRPDDYRAEFAASHPDAAPDLGELAVAGFDNHIYYACPMNRLVIQASRMTAVHAAPGAAALTADIPGAYVRHIHLGHGELLSDAQVAALRTKLRRERRITEEAVVFGVFGALTPEKRVPQVLDAFEALLPYSRDAHLILAGAPAPYYDVAADVEKRRLGPHVTITGYLESETLLTECIAACDVALSLRWPTAREISGPWLRALAAGRPTIIMDLEHLADVPSLDPRTWRLNAAGIGDSGLGTRGSGVALRASPREDPFTDPVTVAIDVMDEAHSLRLAMRRLAADPALRAALGSAGRAYWRREHSRARMLEDYRAALAAAAALPVPDPALPRHLVNDGDGRLATLLGGFGVTVPFRRSGRDMAIADAL
ncbi:MAG: glycosyltransferase family 4 protein [Acidobacteriota bacterium]|nr:glycosyltransferase family 4 protein [Acidobacteriota bacterium]